MGYAENQNEIVGSPSENSSTMHKLIHALTLRGFWKALNSDDSVLPTLARLALGKLYLLLLPSPIYSL